MGSAQRTRYILARRHVRKESEVLKRHADVALLGRHVGNIPTADFDDGTYVAGTDISPGTWRSSGTGASCIWARLSGFGGTLAEVIAADFVTAPATVTIAPGDKGFAASGCGLWKKIG